MQLPKNKKGNQDTKPISRRELRAEFGNSQKRNLPTRIRHASSSMRRAPDSKMACVHWNRAIKGHRSAQYGHVKTMRACRGKILAGASSRRVDLASRRSLQPVAQMTSQDFSRLQRPLRRIGVLIANLLQHARPLHRSGLDGRPSREWRGLGTPRAIGSAARGRRHLARRVGTVDRSQRMGLIALMLQVVPAARLAGLCPAKPKTKHDRNECESAGSVQRIGLDGRHRWGD